MMEALRSSFPLFIEGAKTTLSLTVISILLAFVFGALLAAMRLSSVRPLQWFAQAYLAIIRGTPLVAQIFVVYYGLVSIINVPAFWAAVVGLTAHTAAYMSEIFRSGLRAVPYGQTESARSLGMSRTQALALIVGPQAMRAILPALGNQFIITLKDTSIAGFITVPDLFLQAQKVAAATYEPLKYYLICSLYYLIIVGALTLVLRQMEKRHDRYQL